MDDKKRKTEQLDYEMTNVPDAARQIADMYEGKLPAANSGELLQRAVEHKKSSEGTNDETWPQVDRRKASRRKNKNRRSMGDRRLCGFGTEREMRHKSDRRCSGHRRKGPNRRKTCDESKE